MIKNVIAEKQELETIQRLSDSELKEKVEDKKNDENTSEEEKELITKALPLLDNEQKKRVGKIIIYSIIAKEKESLELLLSELVTFSCEPELINETKKIIFWKMSIINNSLAILPTPLLPKEKSFSALQEEKLGQKIKEQEKIISRLKIAVGILALTSLLSIVSTLKKWYEGEKRKKVSILDKKRELSHHH